MRIETSEVTLGGRHEFASECKVEVSSRCSFRSILGGAAEALTPAAPSAPAAKNDRIRLLLEQLIAAMLALISGQSGAKLNAIGELVAPPAGDASGRALQASPRGRELRELVWETSFSESIRESERSAFSAVGEVRTADGRAIDFKLDLAMSRDFHSERRQVEHGTVVLRDPLVINFDGQAAELGSVRFDFDLDGDGANEAIHGLTGNRGFLAIDRNGDGRINDGRELFGALTGNGFAELAALDGDGNHWLDEADAAFASLSAWSKDSAGRESLLSLKDRGVGALYLASVDTPFSLKDDDNRLRGQLRASGVYLREDGVVGSLQQVDLAV